MMIRTSLRYVNNHVLQIGWPALFCVVFIHYLLSWWVMISLSEDILTKWEIWLYFYLATVTTVGYGDYIPVTFFGKVFTAVFILPGGIILFAALLGKMSSLLFKLWSRNMHGMSDFSHLNGHTVIFGWDSDSDRTVRMINLILADQQSYSNKLVLCTDIRMKNPLPNKIDFIQGLNLNDHTVMHRSGIETAARIIVYRDTDDQTLTTCLAICSYKLSGHIVAWFNSEKIARLLEAHCPNVECHNSLSVDLLVRSAQDPGSSRLQAQLLSTLYGPTQFCIQVPELFEGLSFSIFMKKMKIHYDVLVLAVADGQTGKNLILNPHSEYQVKAKHFIYFISTERITCKDIDWKLIVA